MNESENNGILLSFEENKNYDLDDLFRLNKRDSIGELVVQTSEAPEMDEGGLKINKKMTSDLVPDIDDYKKYLL